MKPARIRTDAQMVTDRLGFPRDWRVVGLAFEPTTDTCVLQIEGPPALHPGDDVIVHVTLGARVYMAGDQVLGVREASRSELLGKGGE